MTAAVTAADLRHGGALTRADLDRAPDDGHRYELIDGALIVTPAPNFRHQGALGELHLVLRAACPADIQVLFAPFDVVLSEDSIVQPDLLAARRSDFTVKELPGAPLLAVEVLSPSTRRIDLMLKRSRYEAAGCHSYWVLDPDEPSVTAWELADGTYRLAGKAVGEEALSLELPFPVALVPAQLFDW